MDIGGSFKQNILNNSKKLLRLSFNIFLPNNVVINMPNDYSHEIYNWRARQKKGTGCLLSILPLSLAILALYSAGEIYRMLTHC